jgi:phosphate transport system protein
MRDAYNEQLGLVLEKLMEMGGLVESMLQAAVRGLTEHDLSAEAQVVRDEDRVNTLQNKIDDDVVHLIAQQQPVAGDLRFVLVASRAANDVERMGDQCVNVVENARYVWDADQDVRIPPDLPAMAAHVQHMMSDALAALVTRDVALAEKAYHDDKDADAYRDRLFRALLRQMISDPLAAQQSMSLVLISRNLERIGDHATNIAEEVIYLVRGQEIRHKMDRSKRLVG